MVIQARMAEVVEQEYEEKLGQYDLELTDSPVLRKARQAVAKTGYEEAASVLSRESGCVSARGEVTLMRKQIKSGLWDEALATLEQLEIDDESVKKRLGFGIREEQ
ncbi:hypothetical protein FOZ63_002671 [Perkinsus olseni]|uniref:Uncharacterized protein n=1 Tax=Perkinsus olseni TaxID=32597 RepID=A0A7J6S4I5_PEROL|nr:hypothetical protein FOZ62_000576 [Perkinsus olseni]KAF4745086.1 hypothetical protein FOZ63_002671 [Perkinsus olseni]